jgi:hypothetical protein
MTEEEKEFFYRDLYDKVKELRIQCLFEEPCPLYEDFYEEDK